MDSIGLFVKHVNQIDYNDLPPAVIENTKKLIVDSIGTGVAGQYAPGCIEALEVVKAWQGSPEATVLLSNFRCPAPWAGMLNSIFMHALDFDDTLDESAHHGNVSVLPAAMAVAEAKGGVSGKDLICAVALGLDVSCRVALSIKTPLSWTRASTCGYFGATTSAAKVLGLNEEKLWNAYGIAYAQTAGNIQALVDGAMAKRMQLGFAVKDSILSVALAEKGVTGAKNVLEGDYGYFKLYERDEYDKRVLLKDLGKDFYGNRLSTKPYPCCRITHAAIDLSLELKKQHGLDLDDIEKITVTGSQMVHDVVGKPFQIRKNPQVDAQFSLPYTVIAALSKGSVRLSDFEEHNVINDNRIADLTRLVEVKKDTTIDARDMMQCSMKILTKTGRVFSTRTDAPKGNPLNPMSLEECNQKFRRCFEYNPRNFEENKVSAILDMLVHLEDLNDVRTLCEALG